MKLIHDLEELGSLREVVTQDLKDIGIKFPKHKKSKTKEEILDTDGGVFGTHLRQVPCLLIDNFGMVPRFLVEATAVLEKHLELEGIFRKSGSVARQKELKDRIELGDELKGGHPYDVASLIKQFFRELPDPLLTAKLHDTFLKVNALETEGQRHVALMLLCLLLPLPHLTTLRYIMCFLSRVAKNAASNKMDTPNLAVCMAPNILHNSTKAEKMNSESKLLHAQTNIVHLLICHAQEIGTVADELYERTCLYGCFQSEDELERSEDLNESKPKKKKKRSGSLQGLVNNLSSSFSKWRKDGRGHNNSNLSDKSSMMSYTSFDQVDVTVTSQTRDELSPDLHQVTLSDVTPKVMRKRKASGEMVPFSASKKKAILQNMPQMATLGSTPFTPVPKRHGKGHAFLVDTPSIKFAEGSGSHVFNATPEGQTPRRRIDKLISPGSATKVKRHTTAKSGCFSPKTTKSGKRKSFKGFLRRLSGGKDQPASATAPDLSSSGVGKRLAFPGNPPDKLIILPPTSDGKKKGGMFRRHNKTPSSPARLLNPLVPVAIDDGSGGVDSPDAGDGNHDILRNHRRGHSSDGGALKRGRPNALSVGLREPNRRSLDKSLPIPVKHSSQKKLNLSPERRHQVSPNAIDTSPIAKVEPLDHEFSSSSPGSESSSGPSSQEGDANRSILVKQASTASLESNIADHDQSLVEDDHDRAFIHDTSMLGENTEDTQAKISDQAKVQEEDGSTEFKKPEGLPPKWRDSPSGGDASCVGNSSEQESLDVTVGSETSDSSVCTVIYNGQPLSSKPPVPKPPPMLKPRGCTTNNSDNASNEAEDAKLKNSSDKYKSASSLDSGIDPGENTERRLHHSPSVGSMKSVDSGLDCDMDVDEEMASKNGRIEDAGSVSAFSRNVARTQSFRASKEGAEPVLLRKCESMRGPRRTTLTAMPVSAEMHHMLSRVGVVAEQNKAKTRAPFVAMQQEEQTEQQEEGKEDTKSDNVVRESVVNLQDAAVVSSSVKEINSKLDRELADKRASPLRFTNSVTRNRGCSPVRIPTIFAKADSEAQKYKQLVTKSLLKSPAKPPSGSSLTTSTGSHKAKPILPISTNLVRSYSVEDAKKRLNVGLNAEHRLAVASTGGDTQAGHTPVKPPNTHLGHLQTININDSLLKTIEQCCTPTSEKLKRNDIEFSREMASLRDSTNTEAAVPHTPQIKSNLFNGQDVTSRLLAKGLCTPKGAMETPGRKYRSPVKPVKRLQGSPRSPRASAKANSPLKFNMSPGKKSKRGALSPIPAHVSDWDI